MQRHSHHGDMTEVYELFAEKELERILTQIRGCRYSIYLTHNIH